MTGFPHHTQIRKVLADFLVQEDTGKLGADDEAIEKLSAIYRERFLELIKELNNGDWSKPINSDELRQMIEAML